jgi:hypothetical protein
VPVLLTNNHITRQQQSHVDFLLQGSICECWVARAEDHIIPEVNSGLLFQLLLLQCD